MKHKLSNLSNLRCVWCTPVLGVDGKLLYFKPLLKAVSKLFQSFTVYTSEFTGEIASAEFNIELCGKFKRMYVNERRNPTRMTKYVEGISIASPKIFNTLRKVKPDLIIINEFSVFSLYCVLAKLLTRSKILCIVETRPFFDRSSMTGKARYILRRIICSMCDAFLTNNISGRDYLHEVLGVSLDRITTQPYLVSDIGNASTHNTTEHDSDNRLHLLYVGQLIQRKGVHKAIEAIADIKDDLKSRIVFDIEKQLVSNFGKLECSPNFRLFGYNRNSSPVDVFRQ